MATRWVPDDGNTAKKKNKGEGKDGEILHRNSANPSGLQGRFLMVQRPWLRASYSHCKPYNDYSLPLLRLQQVGTNGAGMFGGMFGRIKDEGWELLQILYPLFLLSLLPPSPGSWGTSAAVLPAATGRLRKAWSNSKEAPHTRQQSAMLKTGQLIQ